MRSGIAARLFFGGRRFGLDRPLRLGDARLLAAQTAQVIELGAADLAAAHQLDRVDHRRVEREHALDAFAVGNLADGEILVQSAAGTADAHALIGLDAASLAFNHLDVHQDGVAGAELGEFLARRELLDLLFIELLDEVHGSNLRRAAPAFGAQSLYVLNGSAGLYYKAFGLSRPAFAAVLGRLASQVGLPQVGAALPGKSFGLGVPPGGHF